MRNERANVAGWAEAEPLWRTVVGGELRRRRHAQGRTIGETAQRAGVSPQYLSEIERGRKDPSSEMIAAVAGALDLSLIDLTEAATRALSAPSSARQPSVRVRSVYALAA